MPSCLAREADDLASMVAPASRLTIMHVSYYACPVAWDIWGVPWRNAAHQVYGADGLPFTVAAAFLKRTMVGQRVLWPRLTRSKASGTTVDIEFGSRVRIPNRVAMATDCITKAHSTIGSNTSIDFVCAREECIWVQQQQSRWFAQILWAETTLKAILSLRSASWIKQKPQAQYEVAGSAMHAKGPQAKQWCTAALPRGLSVCSRAQRRDETPYMPTHSHACLLLQSSPPRNAQINPA